eukprot:TRINITY_DN4069_c2_g1_i1.p1 TRINITY_DN4069_c2_g1~~TRINITY_DN4069_c2_g1_i1.p1  ORF type:complete len:206 (+),score=59.62 TRINITY_DN4069_c2_g1_i1:125-742(+)
MSLGTAALSAQPLTDRRMARFCRVRSGGVDGVVGVLAEAGGLGTPAGTAVAYSDLHTAVWEYRPGAADSEWLAHLSDAVAAGSVIVTHARDGVSVRPPGHEAVELAAVADGPRRAVAFAFAVTDALAAAASLLVASRAEADRLRRELDAASARAAALEARSGAAPLIGAASAPAPAAPRQGVKRVPEPIVDPSARRRPRGCKLGE